jgi:hypothetical protein
MKKSKRLLKYILYYRLMGIIYFFKEIELKKDFKMKIVSQLKI